LISLEDTDVVSFGGNPLGSDAKSKSYAAALLGDPLEQSESGDSSYKAPSSEEDISGSEDDTCAQLRRRNRELREQIRSLQAALDASDRDVGRAQRRQARAEQRSQMAEQSLGNLVGRRGSERRRLRARRHNAESARHDAANVFVRNDDACVNAEARLAVQDLPNALPDQTLGQYNLKAFPKPSSFSGSAGSSTNVRQWFTIVQRYVFAVCWIPAALVPTAIQFLVGDAAMWWTNEKRSLRSHDKDPESWYVFADALFDRWAVSNQEIAARDKLEVLTQGSRSIHQFLKDFEAVYSSLPAYDEQDKIHRFLFKCTAHWRARLEINPATGKRWTSFQAMANYLVNCASDARAEILQDAHRAMKSSSAARREEKKRDRSASGNRQQQGRGRSASGARSPGRNRGNVHVGSRDSDKPKHLRTVTIKNKLGNTVQRRQNLVNYICSQKKCLFCYSPGHSRL
jgi:hypothetical protein